MGCLCSTRLRDELLVKLQENRQKINELEEYTTLLNGSIKSTDQFSDASLIKQEKKASLEIIMQASEMFSHFSYKEPRSDNFTPQDYITHRLNKTEFLKKVCKELASLVAKLADIDVKNSRVINSTIESFDEIIFQGKYEQLSPHLELLKTQQIALSSNRGGELEKLIERIGQRCTINKEMEIIQAKIEAQQYLEYLDGIVIDSEEFTEELIVLSDKKANTEKVLSTLQAKIDEKQQESDRIRNIKIQSEENKKELEDQIKVLKLAQQKLNEDILEAGHLTNSIKEIEDLIGKLKEEIGELHRIRDEIYQDSKARSRITSKIELNKEYIEELMEKISECEEERKNNYLDILKNDEKEEQIKELEVNISEFESFSTTLSKTVNQNMKDSHNKLKLQVALRLFYSLKEGIEKNFWRWRQNTSNRNVDSNILQRSSYLDSIDAEDFKCADTFIEQEKQDLLDNFNILTRFIDPTNTKQLDRQKLFRFLEELMDKKYETDTKDLKECIIPMGMPEFLYNNFSNTSGIQKNADKYIAQILSTLKSLSEENNIYGNLYCSLFQIHNNDPMSFELAIFLTRARYDFQTLIYKHDRLLLAHGKKNSLAQKSHDYIESGGFASLSDAIDLVVSIFESDRNLGMMALQLLKPDALAMEEFVIFQICQKIARMEKSIESIFSIVDKDSSNSIDRRELVIFTRVSMDVWINESDLDQCFAKLVKPGTSEISREMFIATFNLNSFQEATLTEKYLVRKDRFLNVLFELYKIHHRRKCALIFAMLNLYPSSIGKQDFSEILLFYDKEIADKVDEYYNEATGFGGKVNQPAMVALILRYGIGDVNRGVFAVHELYTELEDRASKTLSKSMACSRSSDILTPKASIFK